MFHREIMAATQEFRRLHQETPSIWMSDELYDLLFNDTYLGWHFVQHVKEVTYFGCPLTRVHLPGFQYLVGTGWEEHEPDWNQLEEMKAEQERDAEEEHRQFMDTIDRWKEQRKENT